jgi:hypothetical protein
MIILKDKYRIGVIVSYVRARLGRLMARRVITFPEPTAIYRATVPGAKVSVVPTAAHSYRGKLVSTARPPFSRLTAQG